MVHFALEREIRSEATNLFEKIIKFAKSKLRKSAGLLEILNQLPICNLKDLSLGEYEVLLADNCCNFKNTAMAEKISELLAACAFSTIKAKCFL